MPARATKHIRKPQLPPGATNAKGKMKYKDSKGESRYIDANRGLVVDEQGKLVHGKRAKNE